VLFDSALAPADLADFVWPKPEVVRDLAYARLLPVRQAIGQFLSGFAPAAIVGGLSGVTVRHGTAHSAEACGLAVWARSRLKDCGAAADLPMEVTAAADLPAHDIELSFRYMNGQHFSWRGDTAKGCAHFKASIGGASSELAIAFNLLGPAAALAEAMFF
jgi:hypothetical protein